MSDFFTPLLHLLMLIQPIDTTITKIRRMLQSIWLDFVQSRALNCFVQKNKFDRGWGCERWWEEVEASDEVIKEGEEKDHPTLNNISSSRSYTTTYTRARTTSKSRSRTRNCSHHCWRLRKWRKFKCKAKKEP